MCKVFLKVPDSKYFRLCRRYNLCCNSSILSLHHEYCHRKYAKKKKSVAMFNKILFNKVGDDLSISILNRSVLFFLE